jgi:hypothetical protein
MKSISLQISNAFDRQMRIQAAQLDMSRSDFIRDAVREKLAGLTKVEGETEEQETRPATNVSEASATDQVSNTTTSEGDNRVAEQGGAL